jgi:hypothetical protein
MLKLHAQRALDADLANEMVKLSTQANTMLFLTSGSD